MAKNHDTAGRELMAEQNSLKIHKTIEIAAREYYF